MIPINVMRGTGFCSSFQMQGLSEIGRILSEGKLDREIMQEMQINTRAQYLGRPEQAQALTEGVRRLL
jgi:hypothetical protein